jgi:hypothetical protein
MELSGQLHAPLALHLVEIDPHLGAPGVGLNVVKRKKNLVPSGIRTSTVQSVSYTI